MKWLMHALWWMISLPISGYASPSIAVCVGGQLARWFPQYLRDGLILPNPSFSFHIFANIQYHTADSPFIYNTDSKLSFQPTGLSAGPQAAVLSNITAMLTAANSKLVSITFTRPLTTAAWKHLGSLDRIEQYVHEQASLLNMYRHQDCCLRQIAQFEDMMAWHFEYVLSTREDVYYFRPMDLSPLVDVLRSCAVVSKSCLSWGGTNMRWQLLTRNASLLTLGKRFEFYKHLIAANRTVWNPEQFEFQQALHYGLKSCTVSIEAIPVTVARHVHDGLVCFPKFEIAEQCVPNGFQEYAEKNNCDRLAGTERELSRE